MADRLIPRLPVEQAIGLTAAYVGTKIADMTQRRRDKQAARLTKQTEYYRLVADLQSARRGK